MALAEGLTSLGDIAGQILTREEFTDVLTRQVVAGPDVMHTAIRAGAQRVGGCEDSEPMAA